MIQVTKQDIGQWGNQFHDRQNSFDDNEDINAFIKITRNDKKLYQYLSKYIPDPDIRANCVWKYHPDGKYKIDLALVDKTGKKHLLIDLERWSQWKNEWPSYYKHLHFLGRKDHFLEEPEPFLMVFFEYNRNKLIVVDKETIKKYPTKRKFFKYKQCYDNVKEMKMSDGHIFGTNLTDIERNHFVKDSTSNILVDFF